MNKIMTATILVLLSIPVFSYGEDGSSVSKSVERTDFSSQDADSGGSIIEGYLHDLTIEDSAAGTVMKDVVRIKKERCDLEMGVQDIKLISSKDEVYKKLKSEVDSDPSYSQSDQYRQTVNKHFGFCG